MLDTEFNLDEFRELFMADAQREIEQIKARSAEDKAIYEAEIKRLKEEKDKLLAQISQ